MKRTPTARCRIPTRWTSSGLRDRSTRALRKGVGFRFATVDAQTYLRIVLISPGGAVDKHVDLEIILVALRLRCGRGPSSSGLDVEAITATISLGKSPYAFIVGHQRARELNRGGNEKPIRRVAVLKMMKVVAAGGGPMT